MLQFGWFTVTPFSSRCPPLTSCALQGLRSWNYAVAPKLQLLSEVLGSEQQAATLVAICPSVLKLPVESKLQPVLGCLAAAGVKGEQLAQLLRDCPRLLGEPRESIVARWGGVRGW
jgi:hypothetical protein